MSENRRQYPPKLIAGVCVVKCPFKRLNTRKSTQHQNNAFVINNRIKRVSVHIEPLEHNLYKTKSFTHIYIEKAIREHPQTLEILAQFADSTIIDIDHYKDIFNRSSNHFRLQKKSTKLILAEKTDPFLYPISSLIQNQNNEDFYYASMVLNCLYDCHYCFLQGMYPSAYIVIFVNIEAFIAHAKAHYEREQKPLFISLSYDSDLLLFETMTGYIGQWLAFLREHPDYDISLEVRTKSGDKKLLEPLIADERFLLCCSLSPTAIIKKYEKKSGSLKGRLELINYALERGFRVGIVFDPLIYSDDFFEIYGDFFAEIFQGIDHRRIDRFIIGTFRMNTAQLKRIKKHLFSEIIYYPYESKNQVSSYPEEIEQEMMAWALEQLSFIPPSKIMMLEG